MSLDSYSDFDVNSSDTETAEPLRLPAPDPTPNLVKPKTSRDRASTRWIASIGAGALALAGAIAYFAFDSFTPNRALAAIEAPAAAIQTVNVTTASPLVTPITEWDTFTGRFVAEQDVTVRARVSGYLTDVAFEDGQMVEQGDILFRIDARPFRAELAAAQAEVTRLEAQLNNARAEAERGERLRARQALSAEEADRRVANLAEIEATLAAAEARVQQARLNVGYTYVRSPITGRVSDDFISVGNLVTGGPQGGTELTSVVSMDPIQFEFTASEADYIKYTRLNASGERVSSRDAENPVRLQLVDENGFPHGGVMSFVDNRIDPSTGTMRGRATFANPDGTFAPGMFGRLQLISTGQYDAVLIPDASVQTDQGEKFVWIDADGIAERRTVTLGPIHEGLRIVRDGLDGSENLIVSGTQFVSAGAALTPTNPTSTQFASR